MHPDTSFLYYKTPDKAKSNRKICIETRVPVCYHRRMAKMENIPPGLPGVPVYTLDIAKQCQGLSRQHVEHAHSVTSRQAVLSSHSSSAEAKVFCESGIKVAVIGVGHLGRIHARIYKGLENCELAAVCDTDKTCLAQVAGELAVPGYPDYRQILGKLSLDAVSITVPTKLHREVAADFLKNNIHALVEKPFTSNLKEADDLIKIARKNRLVLQVGHIERFNSAFAATQKLIKNPKFIECHRLSPFSGRSLDVGAVLDIMIHDIDIVLGLVGSRIRKIEAVGVNVLTRSEDIANARISFANGCVANLTASRVSDEPMRKIRIFQEDTYISLDYRGPSASVYKKEGISINKIDLPIEKEEPLQKELAAFVSCVRDEREPLVSGPVAREALKVAIEIQNQIWRKNKS
jgi:predicted dehydrogenase